MRTVDIYIRNPQISKTQDSDLETSDELALFLQQIEMVLGTPPTSVLGAPQFGVGLEQYLHNFNVSESDILKVVNTQIHLNCSLSDKFEYKTSIEFYKINESETCIIEILVQDNNLVRVVVN